jgi:thioredoxin 1
LVGAALGLTFFLSSGSGGGNSKVVNESSANVARISEAQFEAEVLKAAGPVVVDFYAPWCGPCKRLSPMLDRLAEPYAGKVKVVKLNVDEAPGLARQYQIQGIPALKFFRGGREVGGMVGLPSERELEAQLRQLAATSEQARAE